MNREYAGPRTVPAAAKQAGAPPLGRAPGRGENRSDGLAVTSAARAVIATELVSIARVGEPLLVELGRVLDLILGAIDEHRLGVEIDVADHTRRQHHLLAEDPRPCVDDDEASTGIVGCAVDLPDAPVESLDGEAGQIALRDRCAAVGPQIGR